MRGALPTQTRSRERQEQKREQVRGEPKEGPHFSSTTTPQVNPEGVQGEEIVRNSLQV